MATTYVTSDGDMVDEIAYATYGSSSGAVEAIYAANPGLADYGPILGSGITITLPDLTAAQKSERKVQLWA